MATALDDLRVIDLSTDHSGAWAGRLFADLGADVVLAEPANGHCLRHEPPFIDGVSSLHAYVNWNKRSVCIDNDAMLIKLVEDADLLISNDRAPFPNLLQKAVAALPKSAIHLSITPHGLTGPWATYPGNNLTHSARVGWAAINARVDEPPLQLPVRQAGYISGVAGFCAAVAAVIRRQQTGLGEQVDVSQLEAIALTCAPWALMGLFIGGNRMKHGVTGARTKGTPGPLWKTSDGYINFGYGEWKQWTESMKLLGLDDIAEDEYLIPVLGRQQKDLKPVRDALAASVSTMDKWDIFEGLAKLHCISGVVQNARDLLDCKQLQARGFHMTTEVGGRSLKTAGAPAKLSATPYMNHTAAPTLDQHREDVARATSAGATRNPTNPAAASDNGNQQSVQPLAGVRVLTFTQAWSGTFATELLALLGADVVQIEGRKRPDVWRGGGAPIPPAVRDASKQQSPLNTNGMYNSVNLNKRAITLDMGSEKGREMFWEMLPAFDVVAENFSPHVMSNWGITMDSLREKRPDIIFASLSGYGRQGPWSEFPANGATTEPMSGFASIHGYEDDEAANTAGLIPDPITGYYFAASILSALHHRNKTGEGQRIDEAMMEAVATQMGDGMLHCAASGEIPKPMGNRHPRFAPHNVYQDQQGNWLALAVESDEAWVELCQAIGEPSLQENERFQTEALRKQHEAELDQAVSAWVATGSAHDLEQQLCGRGICAAQVQPFEKTFAEPNEQFLARQFMIRLTHPESGSHYYPVAPWTMTGTGRPNVRYSPCFGEHSEEVFAQELGLSAEDYLALESTGLTGKSRL